MSMLTLAEFSSVSGKLLNSLDLHQTYAYCPPPVVPVQSWGPLVV